MKIKSFASDFSGGLDPKLPLLLACFPFLILIYIPIDFSKISFLWYMINCDNLIFVSLTGSLVLQTTSKRPEGESDLSKYLG